MISERLPSLFKNLKQQLTVAAVATAMVSPSCLAETTTVQSPNDPHASASKTPEATTAVDAKGGSAANNQSVTAAENKATAPETKILLKPGEALSVGTDTQDLVITYDVDLARRQVASFPDSAEARFILAVALSRTSHVEEALQEVRRARRLADAKGGPAYFDKMIATYEEMLTNFPDDNKPRYSLAWAYYMKAYLLAKHASRAVQSPNPAANAVSKPADPWELAVSGAVKPFSDLPHIQGALERADSKQAPEIRKYYEAALTKLDELLTREPNDIWAKVYRAFLKAEYTGKLDEAMLTWKACRSEAPDNPAPYFFMGEGYLRQGNLQECLNNISKAIALRALGK